MRNGFGNYDDNQVKIMGFWKDDMLHGECTITTKALKIKGLFNCGLLSGQASITHFMPGKEIKIIATFN